MSAFIYLFPNYRDPEFVGKKDAYSSFNIYPVLSTAVAFSSTIFTKLFGSRFSCFLLVIFNYTIDKLFVKYFNKIFCENI
ncbi:MAG: hypothetical protein A2321_01300 [Omnitrophica WOR_2 bacterium RIFOXYB2_FULL_45_11]|nr:MAG: hypothetical protein A2216_04220 [Omnitrophica WOR_2 bacterium RIFOXYA2_FULL_45_12]OGX52614.1 MAG: hypothetical protein A2321_01300 [Omnitrophica WOR_2 bacterium RIFOXYB2_FULL_45_11]OGX60875.1 MAG: hypothetical protein A2471_03615 [Omnitrophica WOR_2 bacterium RIFOXYC2_FULL_45_15]